MKKTFSSLDLLKIVKNLKTQTFSATRRTRYGACSGKQ